MDAAPLLKELAAALCRHQLEAVMVGNAAAAIQGAPLTTLDVDFLFRRTRPNVKKLEEVAKELQASLSQPFYPMSNVFRMERKSDGAQIDFLSDISGVRSYEGLRRRAMKVEFGGAPLLIAA